MWGEVARDALPGGGDAARARLRGLRREPRLRQIVDECFARVDEWGPGRTLLQCRCRRRSRRLARDCEVHWLHDRSGISERGTLGRERRARCENGLRGDRERRIADHGTHLVVRQRAERAGARVLIGHRAADRLGVAPLQPELRKVGRDAEALTRCARGIECAYQAGEIEQLNFLAVHRIGRRRLVVARALDHDLQVGHRLVGRRETVAIPIEADRFVAVLEIQGVVLHLQHEVLVEYAAAEGNRAARAQLRSAAGVGLVDENHVAAPDAVGVPVAMDGIDGHGDVVLVAEPEVVQASTAVKEVIAAGVFQPIEVRAADQDVVARFAVEVGALSARDQRVVARPAVEIVEHGRVLRVAGTRQEQIVARLPVQMVGAGAAVDAVVARSAVYRVLARQGVDRVRQTGAYEAVVAGSARDRKHRGHGFRRPHAAVAELDALDRVVCEILAQPDEVGGSVDPQVELVVDGFGRRDVRGRDPRTEEQRIEAAARKGGRAVLVAEDILAIAEVEQERVVAQPADDEIAPGAAAQGIVTGGAFDEIVASQSVDRVVARKADQFIGTTGGGKHARPDRCPIPDCAVVEFDPLYAIGIDFVAKELIRHPDARAARSQIDQQIVHAADSAALEGNLCRSNPRAEPQHVCIGRADAFDDRVRAVSREIEVAVGPCVAAERVVTAKPGQDVVAGVTGDRVGAAGSGEHHLLHRVHVPYRAVGGKFDALHRIGRGAIVQKVVVDRHPVAAPGECENQVAARARRLHLGGRDVRRVDDTVGVAGGRIVVGDRVLAVAAREEIGIVSRSSLEPVVSGTAVERVVARLAGKRVVTAEPGERVVGGIADEVVRPARTRKQHLLHRIHVPCRVIGEKTDLLDRVGRRAVALEVVADGDLVARVGELQDEIACGARSANLLGQDVRGVDDLVGVAGGRIVVGDRVLPVPAIDAIGIVARASGERVVAGEAFEHVRPRGSGERVVRRRAANQHGCGRRRPHRAVGEADFLDARPGRCELVDNRDGIAGAVQREDQIARVDGIARGIDIVWTDVRRKLDTVEVARRCVRLVDEVGAVAAREGVSVVAAFALKNIVAGTAAEPVAAGSAPDRIGSGISLQRIRAIAADELIGLIAARERVVAGLAEKRVGARAAVEDIVAPEPLEHVVAGEAADAIGDAGPYELRMRRVVPIVVLGRAVDVEALREHFGVAHARAVDELDRAEHRRRRGVRLIEAFDVHLVAVAQVDQQAPGAELDRVARDAFAQHEHARVRVGGGAGEIDDRILAVAFFDDVEILAGAADQGIAAGAPCEHIAAAATPQLVIPRAAVEVVAAFLRGGNHAGVVADQYVVACAAHQHVGARFAECNVVAGAGVDEIVARAAEHPIRPGAAVDEVLCAVRTLGDLRFAVVDQLIVGRAAGGDDLPRHHPVVDVHQRASRVADQVVVARAAHQHVRASRAHDLIVARTADHAVVALAAVDPLTLGSGRRLAFRQKQRGREGRCVARMHLVVAVAARHHVAAGPAHDEVGAAFAFDDVGVQPAVQLVVAAAAVDRVAPRIAVKPIATVFAVKRIDALAALDTVVARAGPYRVRACERNHKLGRNRTRERFAGIGSEQRDRSVGKAALLRLVQRDAEIAAAEVLERQAAAGVAADGDDEVRLFKLSGHQHVVELAVGAAPLGVGNLH